jgi:hypothetical protein
MTRSWEKKGPRTTHIRSQLRPRVQLSKGYPNMISYLQMKNFSFKRINPKIIRIWSKWEKECLNITSAREPTCISQMGIKKLFCIFKPLIPLLPNNLHSGMVKLGPRMTRSWEKGAQELHVFARNQDHVYNSQMGIQIWFHISKWRIFLFKNHLHSGLTRINTKTIRIWSKCPKECLNFARPREPTYITQMGIKKLFYIFKPTIPLLRNSLCSGMVKLRPRITQSWEKGPKNYIYSLAIKTTCTTLKWISKYDFIFANEEILFSKITFIRG